MLPHAVDLAGKMNLEGYLVPVDEWSLTIIGWHGRNMLKEGLGLLVGVPSFTALAGLYVYLLAQVRWEREKVEAREKVRTEVVAALAHDIRQPLT